MPFKKSQVNTNQAIYNSQQDLYQPRYSLPEVTINGRTPRIQPKRQKPYWVTSKTSQLNFGDVVKGINTATLGGLNSLSPTQWIRRVYDTGKLIKGDKTLSNYTNSWINGNTGLVSEEFEKEHPYWSMTINGVGDLAFGANLGSFIKLGKPITKINREDYIKLYDQLAPKTNKIINASNEGLDVYEQLTPKAKYFRDRLFFNKEYQKARALGQYPKTFSEKRAYLESLNSDYAGTRERLIQRRINDYDVRHPEYTSKWGVGRGDRWDDTEHANLLWNNKKEELESLEKEIPKKVNFLSKEGHLGFNGAQGFFDPSNNKIYSAIRKRNSLLPTKTKLELRGLNAHEADHVAQDISTDFRNLEEETNFLEKIVQKKHGYNPYHKALNRESYMFNDYAPITEDFRGAWAGAPNEINSEMQNILEQMGTTKSYRNLSPEEKFKADKFMSRRFDTDIDTPVWGNISRKGFFKSGGILNFLKPKKGSTT